MTTHSLRKNISEVVAIDVASTGIKAVRMKNAKDGISVLAADILPSVVNNGSNGHLSLPKALKARQAALSISGENAVIRLISMRENVNRAGDARIREQLGLAEGFRLSYTVTSNVKGKAETKLLAVGVPEQDARKALALVDSGHPAPLSMEISGLSALTAFLAGPAGKHLEEAVAVIECGAKTSILGVFNKGNLVLVRKFAFGGEKLADRVKKDLKVEPDVARQIIVDGSFDISQAVREDMNPFLRQLTISRDFVERHEDCRLKQIYTSGGMSLSKFWRDAVSEAVGIKVLPWDPFETLHVASHAVPDSVKGQWPRFAAAIGAGIGTLRAQ